MERSRGGANHFRVDDEMRNCLNDIINENCLLTLAQINRELRQCLPRKPAIHECPVARTLKGIYLLLKRAVYRKERSLKLTARLQVNFFLQI